MKISCLIAAYKAGNYIGKALESIRSQQHANWEVVVVEDGSRDQTENVVRAFAASVSQPVYYENFGVNRGVASARNRLLELADGEAVSFLDADDWWTPQHLASAHKALERGADLIVARIQLFDLTTGANLETYTPDPALFAHPVERLFERSEIMTSSGVTLRRELVRRAGNFDPSLRIGEDRDYWLRCAAVGGRLADSGEITCYYAKHAGSTMAKTLLWAEQEVAFYRKHRRLVAVPAMTRRSRYAHALTNYGRLVRAHDAKASARALFKAWTLRPYSARTAAQCLLSVARLGR
jgi:glycosyltransferase involved in cell wall biosynthesis